MAWTPRRRLAAVGEKRRLPPVRHVVVVTVDSMVDLWPGPLAGEEVGAAIGEMEA